MKQISTRLSRWVLTWCKWTAPPFPSPNAPLAQRVVARHHQMVSIFLFINLLIMILTLVPVSIISPNPLALLLDTPALLFLGLSIFFNRRGQSNLAGLCPIVWYSLILCTNIMTLPGGLQVFNLPVLDLFIVITVMAALLFPPWYVFPVALGNIGIICTLLLLMPKTNDLRYLLVTQPIIFGAPISLQIVVAIFCYYGGYSAIKTLKEADRADEIQDLYWEQAKVAQTDPLTGLPNTRALMERLSKELDDARRSEGSLSVIFLDGDHFKHVNDKYGHAAGDVVLRQLSKRVCSILRDGDTVGRVGGEEFVILLPETDAKEAHVAAERVRAAVAAGPVLFSEDGEGLAITVSIGISTYPIDGTSEQELLVQADQRMYAAKQLGRNQVYPLAEASKPKSPG